MDYKHTSMNVETIMASVKLEAEVIGIDGADLDFRLTDLINTVVANLEIIKDSKRSFTSVIDQRLRAKLIDKSILPTKMTFDTPAEVNLCVSYYESFLNDMGIDLNQSPGSREKYVSKCRKWWSKKDDVEKWVLDNCNGLTIPGLALKLYIASPQFEHGSLPHDFPERLRCAALDSVLEYYNQLISNKDIIATKEHITGIIEEIRIFSRN